MVFPEDLTSFCFYRHRDKHRCYIHFSLKSAPDLLSDIINRTIVSRIAADGLFEPLLEDESGKMRATV